MMMEDNMPSKWTCQFCKKIYSNNYPYKEHLKRCLIHVEERQDKHEMLSTLMETLKEELTKEFKNDFKIEINKMLIELTDGMKQNNNQLNNVYNNTHKNKMNMLNLI